MSFELPSLMVTLVQGGMGEEEVLNGKTPVFLGLRSNNCCSSWIRGTAHPIFRTTALFSKYFLLRESLRSGLYSDLCALFIGLSTTKDWNSHLWVSAAPGRAWGVNIISAAQRIICFDNYKQKGSIPPRPLQKLSEALLLNNVSCCSEAEDPWRTGGVMRERGTLQGMLGETFWKNRNI